MQPGWLHTATQVEKQESETAKATQPPHKWTFCNCMQNSVVSGKQSLYAIRYQLYHKQCQIPNYMKKGRGRMTDCHNLGVKKTLAFWSVAVLQLWDKGFFFFTWWRLVQLVRASFNESEHVSSHGTDDRLRTCELTRYRWPLCKRASRLTGTRWNKEKPRVIIIKAHFRGGCGPDPELAFTSECLASALARAGQPSCTRSPACTLSKYAYKCDPRFSFFCPNKFSAKNIPPSLAVLLILKSSSVLFS